MSDNQAQAHSIDQRKRASRFLNQNLEEIFRRWEARVTQELPAVQGLDMPLLRDHLPPYIKAMVYLLENCTVTEARNKAAHIGQLEMSAEETHGRLRATLPGYSVDQVIEEYIILRQVITDALAEKALLDPNALEIIMSVNEHAIAEATTQFSHSLEILRQKAVSMLMHDIRNPLNVISLTAEVVGQRSRDPKLKKDIATIRSNVGKIDGMAMDLLDAVRLGAGQGLEFQFTESDLKQLIIDSTDGAVLAYPERIQVQLPPEPIRGMFDRSGVTRAAENLLSNAIKYGAPDKKIQIELTIEDDRHIVSVHNWGEPIPEKEQTTLFVTYARGPEISKRIRERGWGLGLAYVKAVAEGHGGGVWVDSSQEEGTTFSMWFPRNRGSEEELAGSDDRP